VAKTTIRKLERKPKQRVDRFAERRAQLTASALRTLSEQGFARTSLRDIADNSDFSHGVLHYYFSDKVDLIAYCVKHYKAECVKRYDRILAAAASAKELAVGFSAALARTLHEDAALHRLWYDLRNQSLFDESFRGDVLEIDRSLERMIGRIVGQYADLTGSPLAFPQSVAYAMFDGLFQQALLRHLAGEAGAAHDLEQSAERLMSELVVRPAEEVSAARRAR
jgi:AcrR family transcriptional regulator